MAYRPDASLSFLAQCDSEDLQVLAKILKCAGDWKKIAEEIQLNGGNSLMRPFRGGDGILYREVIRDVCDKIGIQYPKRISVRELEFRLLAKLLEKSLAKMSESERSKVLKGLGVKSANITGPAAVAAIQAAVVAGGFLSYQGAVIVANAVAKAVVGSGLSLGANAAMTRTLSLFAGPIGWTVTGLWTALEISGPAYRKTIPACVQVGYLRMKLARDLESRPGKT
jgi:uncharacterized protein YaaW (UPF0174 family)